VKKSKKKTRRGEPPGQGSGERRLRRQQKHSHENGDDGHENDDRSQDAQGAIPPGASALVAAFEPFDVCVHNRRQRAARGFDGSEYKPNCDQYGEKGE
jgi:hypothetical protein